MAINPFFDKDGKILRKTGERLKLATAIFVPFVSDDLEPDKGVLISSKAQYKSELKARGFECRGLM